MIYSFPNLEHVVPCLVPTVASWPTLYRFLRRLVRWLGIPICLRIFQFVVIHIVKGFSIVNEEEVGVFWNSLAWNLCNLAWNLWFYGFDNLISGFSTCWKSRLNIWKFSIHVLLKPSLNHFEHYLAGMWNECNCVVVWTFFGIALLWAWNENWPFPVLWPLLSFPNLLAYWVQHFHSVIF